MKFLKCIPLQIILFIFFFGCLSLFLNTTNTSAYGLQGLGISSLIEHGHFYIDDPSSPDTKGYLSNATWDVFQYNDHIYLNKQPGQFIIAGIVYFFLTRLGISYTNNSILVSNLIALCTSVLMTAIMLTLLFNISLKLTDSKMYSFIVSSFCGLGTIILPYSMIPHHDIYATFFLFLGFYLLFHKYRILKRDSSFFQIALAGLSVGFSLFNSCNVFAVILSMVLYVVLNKDAKDIILFIIFLLVGLFPSFLFNYLVLDYPLHFPATIYSSTMSNPLGNITVTQFSVQNLVQKIDAYLLSPLTSITFFSPIVIISLLGFILFPKRYSNEKITLLLLFVFQLLQLSTIEAIGWCQYGPRYLLESIPFTLIGLSGFFVEEKNSIGQFLIKSKYLLPTIFSVGLVSIVICAVGTMGVIYCGYYENAFLCYLKKIISGELPNYYFIPIGIACILISILLYFLRYPNNYKKLKQKLIS